MIYHTTNRSLAGTPGFILAAVIMTCLAIVSNLFTSLPTNTDTSSGICFSSPDNWIQSPAVSCCAAVAIVLCIAFTTAMINRHFNFMRGTTILFSSLFMLLCGANPWITTKLSSSIIVATGCICCIGILFSQYSVRNATGGIFAIFTVLAWGSMVQYSFLLLMPVFFVGSIMMKAMRVKEFLAALCGIIAPYWFILGTGIVSPWTLHIPRTINIFYRDIAEDELFVFGLLIICGITALCEVLLGLANYMRIHHDSIRSRTFVGFIRFLGFCCAFLMLIDYTNFPAYCVTLNFCVAIEATYFFNPSMSGIKMLYTTVASLSIASCIAFISL